MGGLDAGAGREASWGREVVSNGSSAPVLESGTRPSPSMMSKFVTDDLLLQADQAPLVAGQALWPGE